MRKSLILDARIEPVCCSDSGQQIGWGVYVVFAATGEEVLRPLIYGRVNESADDVLLDFLIRGHYDFAK